MSAFVDSLAAVNATLNSLSAICLLTGYYFIRTRQIERHKWSMIGAGILSSLFLIFYLIRVYNQGTHVFPGSGPVKAVYLLILLTHVVLAIVQLPLIATTFHRGLTGRYQAHRKVARVTLPLWTYVSVTGVVVYLMLYQLS